MTISVDITQAISVGQNPTTNVTVTNLGASSAEMPFAAALTRAIVEFTKRYRKIEEEQEGEAK